MIIQKQVITPEMAEEMLSDSRFKNRKIRQATVDIYADDMSNGRWKENGETIKITSDDRLIDGQHRLHAIIRSGKPQELLIVRGISPDVVDTIDTGLKRSLENALQFQGRAYETGAASVVNLRMTLRKGLLSMGQSNANNGISRTEMADEYENFEGEYTDATKFGREIYTQSKKTLNKMEVGAIYLHLIKDLRWEHSTVVNFFINLVNAPRTGKSIFTKTMDELSNKTQCRGKCRLMQYVKCWNAYVKGCTSNRPDYSNAFLKPTEI